MTAATIIITLLGGLALFLFGMKTMSDGLQKVAGPTMRTILSKMTGNRFSGVCTGMLITTMVQSSSATTVMLISFVSAGLLTLTQAVGVVMGANIGTTLTGWIVALFGFKFKIILLSFPAIFLGIVPRLLGMHKLVDWAEVLAGTEMPYPRALGNQDHPPMILERNRKNTAPSRHNPAHR